MDIHSFERDSVPYSYDLFCTNLLREDQNEPVSVDISLSAIFDTRAAIFDTRAANEVGGGNIDPSIEGNIEASSLFTEEVIKTRHKLRRYQQFNRQYRHSAMSLSFSLRVQSISVVQRDCCPLRTHSERKTIAPRNSRDEHFINVHPSTARDEHFTIIVHWQWSHSWFL